MKASRNQQLRSVPPGGPYAVIIQCDDSRYEVVSFFRQITYRVRIFLGISSNAVLTEQAYSIRTRAQIWGMRSLNNRMDKVHEGH